MAMLWAAAVDGQEPRHPVAPGWHAATHALGRGRFRAEGVIAHGDGFRLRLPAGSCDGAELRMDGHAGPGEYTARLRTPVAPGSLSAFFFYGNVQRRGDEIDVEIHNDGSRAAILTAWQDGIKSHSAEVTLPFDPAAGFHDYTMRWGRKELVFLADGQPLARWTSGYPVEPMRLMASVWWPRWLECAPLHEHRFLEIERIVLAPNSSPR